MKRTIFLGSIVLALAAFVNAQINATIGKAGEKPSIAVPDFRGSGDAQNFMGVFNKPSSTIYQAPAS
jgi:hypothetical protein